jgi:hypothetical protein
MEEGSDLAGVRIDTGEVRALVLIAVEARQRQVCGIICPTVLLRDDVLDVQRGNRQIFLGQQAVLTAIARSLPHLPSSGRIDHKGGSLARSFRALA